MSIIDSISLFAIMVTLAIIPSTSVALVVTRSATLGVANGVAVAAGIVAGDLVFIILAILGLSVIAETMGGFFMVIKYMGGAYLLCLGYTLITPRNETRILPSKARSKGSLIASFMAGFFLTLGDVKVILFYVSLFPIFLNLSALNISDVVIIFLLTITTVGGVKIAYAFSARKIISMSQGLKLQNVAKKAASGFMIGAGSYLIVKA